MQELIVNPYTGLFIAFEGIDGSGKSTQASRLAERMRKEGYSTLLTGEPTTESNFGRLVRCIYTHPGDHVVLREACNSFFTDEETLLWILRRFASKEQKRYLDMFQEIAAELTHGNHKRLPLFVQLCMIFDRLDHRIRTEIPALEKGIHVISDRDFWSTLAYGNSDGIPWKKLLAMQKEIISERFIVPDIIFYLDISPRLGLARTLEKQKGKKEYFDDGVKLAITYATYRDILLYRPITQKSTVCEMLGTLMPDALEAIIWNLVAKKLK